LIFAKLLLEFRLRGFGNIRRIDIGGEIRSALLHLVTVFAVTPEHEILLVTAHHQHVAHQHRLVQCGDLCFDIVDGYTQTAFKAGIFVETELQFLVDDRSEMSLILLQRRVHGLDLAAEIRLADGDDLLSQRLHVGGDGFTDLDLLFGPLGIVTQKKILLGSTSFQQFDFDPVIQFRYRPRVFRRNPVTGRRGFAVHVNGADQDDADDADNANGRNLVG